MVERDRIVLSVPARPEYLLVVRLTAAGLANRMEFDVETIEDIKSAVAESCILLMNQDVDIERIDLNFSLGQGELLLRAVANGITCVSRKSEDNDNELSHFLIEALVDKVEIIDDDIATREVLLVKKVSL